MTASRETCSFCGASSDSVPRLFAAPNAAVCDGCVRLLAAEVAKSLAPSGPGADRLLGCWTRRSDDKAVSVSLRFTAEGLLHSTIREASEVREVVLRYSLDGAKLSTVELVPCGELSCDTAEIEENVLTIQTKRGTSKFDRDD